MTLNCYIDESGDEGIETRGSRWFIMGALIVSDAINDQTGEAVSRIKKRFNKDNKWTLHWSKIKKPSQKRYICEELQTEQWIFICIATDKTHSFITGSPGLKQKHALYFYSARLLLERMSWYARDNGNLKALPIYEYSSNICYDEMRNYFRHLRGWMPPTQVSWNNVEYRDFKIFPKHQRRLLQAADCLCGTVKDALEYDSYGFFEDSYVLSIKSRFYRRGNNLFSYGLKFLHAQSGTLKDLKKEYEWLEKI